MNHTILQAQAEGGMSFFILIGGMFLIMYFFMIRPQVKKQKEAKSFREELSKGDKVVTIGGIHGKVVDMNERTVLLQVDGAKIRMEKTCLESGRRSIGRRHQGQHITHEKGDSKRSETAILGAITGPRARIDQSARSRCHCLWRR
jgi:preprotein translocase subunit YajC